MNSAAARPSGRCFVHAATIIRSGGGADSERYSGRSFRATRTAIAGISEMPTLEETNAWIVSNYAPRPPRKAAVAFPQAIPILTRGKKVFQQYLPDWFNRIKPKQAVARET
jgi:hypothetical protein